MDLTELTALALEFQKEWADQGSDPRRIIVYTEDRPTEFEAVVYDPVVCLILQGSKETVGYAGTVHLHPGEALLVCHDTPVTARITGAAPGAPYVAAIVRLDLAILRSLSEVLEDDLPRASAMDGPAAFQKLGADAALAASVARVLALRPGTAEARVLSDALLREVHFRLLTAPGGATLRRLVLPGSHESRIARAIDTIRASYREPLRISALSRDAGMGQSTFHTRFREVTGTTPLQYQKDLRLTEARRMIRSGGAGVSDAGYAVGYESAAQFSRDYSRKFGAPPSRDRPRVAALA